MRIIVLIIIIQIRMGLVFSQNNTPKVLNLTSSEIKKFNITSIKDYGDSEINNYCEDTSSTCYVEYGFENGVIKGIGYVKDSSTYGYYSYFYDEENKVTKCGNGLGGRTYWDEPCTDYIIKDSMIIEEDYWINKGEHGSIQSRDTIYNYPVLFDNGKIKKAFGYYYIYDENWNFIGFDNNNVINPDSLTSNNYQDYRKRNISNDYFDKLLRAFTTISKKDLFINNQPISMFLFEIGKQEYKYIVIEEEAFSGTFLFYHIID